MLTVRTENFEHTVTVRCSGRLVAGKAAWALYDTVISQQNKGVVLLDLTGVNRVDARGLGVLAFLKKWVNEAGAKVELIPSKPVRELLELAGLSYEWLRSSEIDQFVPISTDASQNGTGTASTCFPRTRPSGLKYIRCSARWFLSQSV